MFNNLDHKIKLIITNIGIIGLFFAQEYILPSYLSYLYWAVLAFTTVSNFIVVAIPDEKYRNNPQLKEMYKVLAEKDPQVTKMFSRNLDFVLCIVMAAYGYWLIACIFGVSAVYFHHKQEKLHQYWQEDKNEK